MTSPLLTTQAATPPVSPFGGPVPAVVVDGRTALAFAGQAAAAVRAVKAPLVAEFLHARAGFGTGFALLAWAARQRNQRLQSLLVGLAHTTGRRSVGVLLSYGPRHSHDRLIARAVTGATRHHEARLVVASSSLGRASARLGVATIGVAPPSALVAAEV